MNPTQVHRRQFLKGTAVAVGTTPYIWTSSYAKAKSKNDRLAVAAIGLGYRGVLVGHQAAALGDMLACADVDRRRAEGFAGPSGKCKPYEDYRRVLDRRDIDAVVISTPDHWHAAIAIAAMKAGKDVYCEKPLSLTIGESKQIQDTVKQTERVFQVGTQQRSEFASMFLKAVAIARSGRLGDRLSAVASIGGGGITGEPLKSEKVPSYLNYDLWLGQAPKVEFVPDRVSMKFRWWLEYSGGHVTDWGVHHTDIALWALGGEKTGVAEVEGKGKFPGLPEDVNIIEFLNGKAEIPPCYNVADQFDVQMKLANGNTVNLRSGGNELIIEGDKGKILVNRGRLVGKPIEDIESSKRDSEWLDAEVNKLYRGMPIEGHMANFFHCIKSREVPISDVDSHCHSVNACHMANIAMLLKRKIAFDHQKYEFVGDDEANQFIARKQRSPYSIEELID